MPQMISDPVADGPVAVHASNGTRRRRSHTDAMDYIPDYSHFDHESTTEPSTGTLTFKPLWAGSHIDRRELVRLAMQAFEEMGYHSTVQALQAESGFQVDPAWSGTFKDLVLHGNWKMLDEVWHNMGSEVKDSSAVKFLIGQQKFLEALEQHETKRALSLLRNELAPLNHDSDRLHFLSSLIMCPTPEDLRARANWDGAAGDSRRKLIVSLQEHISPETMMPLRRLEVLLEQSKAEQRRNCPFHAHDVHISLLKDCQCDPGQFPSYTTRILKEHTDEIWRLEFSHDGKWLATAGRDKTVIIWNVTTGFTLERILRDHSDFISCLAWSPDDSVLLTVAESVIKMWNTETGTCIATLAEHSYQIGAIAWLPDGQQFVSGGMDSQVLFWDLAGNVVGRLPKSPSRVIDLAISPDGKVLVAVGRADTTLQASRSASVVTSRSATPAPTPPITTQHEKRISVFSLPDKKLITESVQPKELTSVSISDDSRFAIVNHAPSEILYIDLQDGTIIRRYAGHTQGEYVLQSCFGGALQNFILSGSEDGKVYVWHRDTGALVHTLVGHGPGSVNAVSWNKKHRGMFASASDDRTVRIWEIAPASSDPTA